MSCEAVEDMTIPNNSKSPSKVASDLKVRQLQQYLHRPGYVAASTHPFVKQVILAQRHPKRRFSMKGLIAGGLDLNRTFSNDWLPVVAARRRILRLMILWAPLRRLMTGFWGTQTQWSANSRRTHRDIAMTQRRC